MIKLFFAQKGIEYNYFILYGPPPQHFQITGVYYGHHDFAERITGWSSINLVTEKQLQNEYGKDNIREGIKYTSNEIKRKFMIMALNDHRKI